ncbi:hypothetical protein DUNSADRAFT_2253 [Dunaliella salina]|uniref:Serine aminopeptidase S33 domain-containing protein n=1 Tax=Dunaliella salina TaxID=3046 RepID=A0ABQ7GW57_DUNSA|nr:hypothetical protein DUNSADRAFT_2253 [Dunaliella salina]|eukprot:KAF5838790.1 hypothetical protein DUNSADRAFT_2253 [Dunaliella salina]
MEGVRCYCDSLDDYVEDLVTGAKRACTLGLVGFPSHMEYSGNPLADGHMASFGAVNDGVAASPMGSHPSLPHFVLGASLGGCLATVASLKYPHLFNGTILLAAMLSLEKVSRQGLNPYLLHFGNLLSYFLPTLPCANASKNNAFPDLQVAYDADPNCWQGMTRARNAMEYVRWTNKLMAPGGMEQVISPLLIFHGLNDDLCDSDGSKALYLRASSQDKTLRLLENFWHVLTKVCLCSL